MKTNNKKIRFSRLSIKIILMLIGILFTLWFLIFIVFSIARSAGFESPKDKESMELWLKFVLHVFLPFFGLGIIIIFAHVLNKTIVARIRSLEKATTEVAAGNFDISIKSKGKDELSDLTHSFNLMSAELKINEYLGKEFTRNVSHEFKTPISVIRAYGELMQQEAGNDMPDKTALADYADVIIKQSDRLALLSKSILQLSLLDSTTIIRKDDTFNIAEQIRDILRLLQIKWQEKGITLDLHLKEITIKNNEQLVYQIWQNLISNAIKFSRQNGTIKIILTENKKGILFEITDNGIGISEENKAKIFELFFIEDSSRNTQGSGLGLVVIQKILSKIGGDIKFESTKDKGSVFSVQL